MVFVTCWHLNLYDCDHVLLYLVLLSRTSFLSNRLFLLTLLPSRLCWLFGQILCIVRFLRLFLSRGFFDRVLFSFSLFSLLPLVLLLLCSGRLEEEHTYLTLASKNCWQQKIVLKKKKKGGRLFHICPRSYPPPHPQQLHHQLPVFFILVSVFLFNLL